MSLISDTPGFRPAQACDSALVVDPVLKSLIPPLENEERALLEKSLIQDGCRDPLVVWPRKAREGRDDEYYVLVLIDGHNRYEICTKHGIEFDVIEMEFSSITDVRIWMRNNQMGRRNITPAWRIDLALANKEDLVAIGATIKVEAGKEARSKQLGVVSENDNTPIAKHNTRQEIAKAANTSTGMVAMAERVREAAPDLWEKAKSGEVTVSAAYSDLKKAEKKAQREADITRQRDEIASGAALLPDGVFEVVAMDPPWNYGREYDPDSSRVANPYPEMTQQQLLEMAPPFADDCVLFLWTTHQFIFDAKELLDHWGFQYKANLVWDKQRMGMGAWLRMQCEFCLVGIRGKPVWQNTKWRDIIQEPRREHSRKPELFYQLVEEVTVGRRLEMFSRDQREGWGAFGNDTNKF